MRSLVAARRAVVVLAVALAASACTADFAVRVGSEPGSGDVEIDGADAEARAGRSVATADSSPSPPSTTTSTTSTTTTAPPPPLVLGFAGDVHMIGSMVEREPLAGVAELLQVPDLMMVNLETVVGEAAEVGPPPIPKPFLFRSPPEALDQLVAAGVDVVGLANNHTWDHGPAGARVTRSLVDASSLLGTGAGPDPATAYAPVFAEVDGATVGIVSLTRVPCDWSQEAAAVRPEIAWACDRHALGALAAITEAEAAADHTVVLLHGGTEVTDCPDPRLREVVGTWIGMGVDVVAISHPHVLQGVEVIDGAAVLWSTGNFAFRNGGGRTGRSALFLVTLGGGDPVVQVVPTVLPGGIAAPADPETAARVRQEVGDRSVRGAINGFGVLVDDPAPSRCD